MKDWIKPLKQLGFARGTIIVFTLLLFVMAAFKNMDLGRLMSDALLRVGRSGILVLALLPAVRSGLGLNFGLPLGILAGLLALVLVLNEHITGWGGLLSAMGLALFFGSVAGVGYGQILNRVRGQEMMVGTYLAFAFVSLFCVFWVVAPVSNHEIVWAIGGKGLRTTMSLKSSFDGYLDNLGMFALGNLKVPTGTLIFFGILCGLWKLFEKTRWGVKMNAVGLNDRCARASGINIQSQRLLGATVSSALAALGIVVYSQSFGFVQIYNAPLYMAFPVIACLLIGGASLRFARLQHVVFGTIIFQTLLTISLPVASQYLDGDISEVARIIISNGIILYALVAVKAGNAA